MYPNQAGQRHYSSILFLLTLVLAGCLLLTGCGSSGKGSSASTGQTGAEPAPEMTAEEVQKWTGGSTEFTGRRATVAGQVFNIQRDGDTIAYQIHTDPTNYDGNTVIAYQGDDPGISKNDYIRATGTVADRMNYENAFGASMSAALLKADTIEKSSYEEVAAPARVTIEPNITSEHNGYSVTLSKVDFADNETRFHVIVTNNGAGKLSVYDYSAVVVQNGRQFNTENNFHADYPTINNQVAIGATVEGVICFPAMEQASMQLQLKGYSDNYQADGSGFDFVFDIQV